MARPSYVDAFQAVTMEKSVFDSRIEVTDERIAALSRQIRALNIDPQSACVYATGSVARGEATTHSDLDLFIVDTADESRGSIPLSKISATLLKADLIRASERAGFPPFSGDGIYLEVHRLGNLIRLTGLPQDDYSNAFTARMLMLLESRAILNEPAHRLAQERIVRSYWRDYEANPDNFLPVFLVNDIVRYWKTVCLNYEAERTLGAPTGVDADSWRNRNRLRNIKLKFSRLWMCHASLAHLLWLAGEGGGNVTPDQMLAMLQLTPLQRLEPLADSADYAGTLESLTELYSWFLETFDGSKEDSLEWVADQSQWQDARARGGLFADKFWELLVQLGSESPLFRFLVV